MRALVLAAAAALPLAACGDNQAAENTVNVDGDLTADNITANDTTSIDAATGEAANMAAEAEIPIDNSLNETGNDSGNAADNGTTSNSD